MFSGIMKDVALQGKRTDTEHLGIQDDGNHAARPEDGDNAP